MQVTFKVRKVTGLFFLGIISGFITGLSIQLPTFRSIAVTDSEMDEVWLLVPDGIPIEIRP
jgi:hypothetical protein